MSIRLCVCVWRSSGRKNDEIDFEFGRTIFARGLVLKMSQIRQNRCLECCIWTQIWKYSPFQATSAREKKLPSRLPIAWRQGEERRMIVFPFANFQAIDVFQLTELLITIAKPIWLGKNINNPLNNNNNNIVTVKSSRKR